MLRRMTVISTEDSETVPIEREKCQQIASKSATSGASTTTSAVSSNWGENLSLLGLLFLCIFVVVYILSLRLSLVAKDSILPLYFCILGL